MQRTYRAILHGSRIEWIDDPPELSGPTRVETPSFHHQKPKRSAAPAEHGRLGRSRRWLRRVAF
jgi:hypothetical protein